MKKGILLVFVAALMVTLVSCKKNNEKLIVGNWTLNAVDVENLDKVINALIETQKPVQAEQLQQINDQLETLENPEEKAALEAIKAQIEDQVKELTPDKMKADFLKQFEQAKGNYSFTFNEDKSYERAMQENIIKGSWILSEDGTILTTTDEGSEEPQEVEVIDVSDKKLVIVREENQGDLVIKIKMEFEKK